MPNLTAASRGECSPQPARAAIRLSPGVRPSSANSSVTCGGCPVSGSAMSSKAQEGSQLARSLPAPALASACAGSGGAMRLPCVEAWPWNRRRVRVRSAVAVRILRLNIPIRSTKPVLKESCSQAVGRENPSPGFDGTIAPRRKLFSVCEAAFLGRYRPSGRPPSLMS